MKMVSEQKCREYLNKHLHYDKQYQCWRLQRQMDCPNYRYGQRTRSNTVEREEVQELSFCKECGTDAFTEVQHGSLLQQKVPPLTTLDVCRVPPVEDAMLARVLGLFPNLTELRLEDIEADSPLTCKAIGGLKKLEELSILDGGRVDDGRVKLTRPCFPILAASLEGLPNLRKLTCHEIKIKRAFEERVVNGRDYFLPLVGAVGGKQPHLELYMEQDGAFDHNSFGDRMETDLWNALQNGNGLDDAMQLEYIKHRFQSLVEDNEAEIPQDLLTPWMETMLALGQKDGALVEFFHAMLNKLSSKRMPVDSEHALPLLGLLKALQVEGRLDCFHAVLDKLPIELWQWIPSEFLNPRDRPLLAEQEAMKAKIGARQEERDGLINDMIQQADADGGYQVVLDDIEAALDVLKSRKRKRESLMM